MTTAKTTVKVAALALVGMLAAGCEGGGDVSRGDGEGADVPLGGGSTPEPAAVEGAARDGAEDAAARPGARGEAVDPALLALERLLRRVERSGATPADADALGAIVAEGQLPADALDRASLGLSLAREAAGDAEGAVRAVEDLMRRRGGDGPFEAREAAARRLRLLVSGAEEPPPSHAGNMEPVAPVARALAPHFPEDARGATLLDILSVGKPPTHGDPHGIYNLRGAKRAIAEEECAVCDVDIRVQRSHSRVDSWVDLPLLAGEHRPDMPNPERSLVVVYFDLEQNRVPSRYDAYLAVPSAETVSRLERGDAFVAFRDRPGKKPLLLVAAPRAGQLDQVESALAAMTELPTSPRTIEVEAKLLPHEIQGVVRGGFRFFRGCYEALLANDPTAAGKVTLSFRVDGEGHPQDVAAASSFADDAIGTCIAEHAGRLRFPAAGRPTSVTYPITFSP